MRQRLYLIGFSGTGKSTVSRLLARKLGYTAIDTDARIVEQFGKPIDRVFAEDGEPAFRAAERDAILRASVASRSIVSVGGGAMIDTVARSVMLSSGAVALLDASPKTILARLAGDHTEARPLLTASDPLARITELRARRMQFYRCAHHRIDTDHLSPDEVATLLEEWFQGQTENGG